MTLPVNISSLQQTPGVETTFYRKRERARGTVSPPALQPGERLCFALLPGDFRATASRGVLPPAARPTNSPLGSSSLSPVARWDFQHDGRFRDHLHG